jgi:hypothetical protein
LTIECLVPSPHVLRARAQHFAEQPNGIITAWSDSALRWVRDVLGPDTWVEIEPFPTLIRRYLTLTGAESPPIPNSRLREMAIGQAVESMPADHIFANAKNFPGSHRALAKTIEELHARGIDGDILRDIAQRSQSNHPALARRLSDLADVEQMAANTLHQLGFGGELSLIRTCQKEIPDFDTEPAPMLVIAGDQYSPMRTQWLAWLARSGVPVTVLSFRHASRTDFFSEVQAMVGALEPYQPQIIGTGAGSDMAVRLFGTTIAASEPVADVKIVAESDAMVEVEQALRHASEAPDDTVIFVRSPDYLPLLEAAASRLIVPLRYLRQDPLRSNAFTAKTLALLESLAQDDVRELGYLVATVPYPVVPREDRMQRLEIARAATLTEDPWTHFEAEIAQRERPEEAWIRQVLDWRKRVGGFIPARDWITYYQELREFLPWQNEATDADITVRNAAAAVVMEQCLAAHASVACLSPDAQFDFREFVAITRQNWNGADYSVERSEPGGVRVVSDLDAIPPVKTVIALGLNEGTFPRRPSMDPVLADEDRRLISEYAPEFAPLETTSIAALSERTDFYRLAISPGRSLIVSYPVAADGRSLYPTVFLDRLADAAGSAVPTSDPVHALAPVDSPLLIDQELRKALDGPRHFPEWPRASVATRNRVAESAGKPVRYWNIGHAQKCPFRFTVSERTQLRTRDRRLRWRRLVEVPANARLAVAPTAELEERLSHSLDLAVSGWSAASLDWELRTLEESRDSLVEGWARRERQSRENWHRVSTRVNVSLEAFNDRIAKKMGGIQLAGVIPAISETPIRQVIHLYEAGAYRDPAPTDERWWQYALLWMAFERTDLPTAIEIDFTSGPRVDVLADRVSGDGFGISRSNETTIFNLRVPDVDVEMDGTIIPLRKAVFGYLTAARDVILAGESDPRPGDHCLGCGFGELCRRHRDYGDLDDPFVGSQNP